MHYPKVVSAATGDRSHSIAGVSLRAQNSVQQKESRFALPKAKENLINRIWYNMLASLGFLDIGIGAIVYPSDLTMARLSILLLDLSLVLL